MFIDNPLVKSDSAAAMHAIVATAEPGSAGGSQLQSEELDRHNISVILNTAYEWGGYRYTNASDAIAAARRAAK